MACKSPGWTRRVERAAAFQLRQQETQGQPGRCGWPAHKEPPHGGKQEGREAGKHPRGALDGARHVGPGHSAAPRAPPVVDALNVAVPPAAREGHQTGAAPSQRAGTSLKLMPPPLSARGRLRAGAHPPHRTTQARGGHPPGTRGAGRGRGRGAAGS
uniref:Uncharacterized protein n=1 Tax=Tetraselmis sp. GSL018 TaxID=582737 RepID=A0A061QN69_9CHLO